MKKTKVRNFIIGAILVGITIWMLQPLFYPNVVTGINPIKEIGEDAKLALNNIASSKNKDSALNAAVNLLPDAHGATLEERVAFWVNVDYQKIDSMKFKLVSGVGISATNAEKQVKQGYVGKKDGVVVQIFSAGKSEEYFLICANGLVNKRWPNLVSETEIGATREITHLAPNTSAFITKGGSLFRDLEIRSLEEALSLAKENNLKYWYGKKGFLYVLVKEDDEFHFVNGKWEPVK